MKSTLLSTTRKLYCNMKDHLASCTSAE